MAQQVPDPIYFLITDLAIPKNKIGSVLTRLRRLDPFKNAKGSKRLLSFYHFAPIKHWAVRIRDYCYEVNSEYDEVQKKNKFVLHKGMHIDDWQAMCKVKDVTWESIEVGATVQSDESISQKSDLVWKDHLHVKYKLFSQNCQNFAYCLYGLIAVDPNEVDEEIQRAWKRMPFRVTQYKSVLKRIAPYLARSLMIEGIELSIEGAALIGLEVLGASLLGPAGEIILIMSILAALFLAKSNDSKWLKYHGIKKISNKKDKKDKKLLTVGDAKIEDDVAVERQMEEIISAVAKETEQSPPPPYKFDNSQFLQENGTPTYMQPLSQHAALTRPLNQNDSIYRGYHQDSVDQYVELGYSVEHIVAVLKEWKIDSNDATEFTFDDADHQTMLKSLSGDYGFDEVISVEEGHRIPRKALPASAAPELLSDLIGTKSPGVDEKEMLAPVGRDRGVFA